MCENFIHIVPLIKKFIFHSLNEMSENDPPPVLSKQATCGVATTADIAISTATTCTGTVTVTSSINDSFTKTTTIATPSSSSSSVSDSVQITSGLNSFRVNYNCYVPSDFSLSKFTVSLLIQFRIFHILVSLFIMFEHLP